MNFLIEWVISKSFEIWLDLCFYSIVIFRIIFSLQSSNFSKRTKVFLHFLDWECSILFEIGIQYSLYRILFKNWIVQGHFIVKCIRVIAVVEFLAVNVAKSTTRFRVWRSMLILIDYFPYPKKASSLECSSFFWLHKFSNK